MFSQLFPLKDTTLYSKYPEMNAGLDQILEFTKPDPTDAARILLEFDQEEITNTVAQATSGWKAYLRVYCSEIESLPTKITIQTNPVAQAWDQGTGASYNNPITTNGASWLGPTTGSYWTFNGTTTTGSYLSGSVGGGSWYTTPEATQSITQYTPQDLYMDVTSLVTEWYSNTIPNNGMILRVTSSIENNPNSQYMYSL